ncbi:MAG: class B sortase [Propionibacteriaceae bacterium]|nr:class B sortase [Propionibacteriaceae bacterium]
MTAKARFARAVIAAISGAVDLVVILVVMVLLAFSGYAIWDSGRIDQQAEAVHYQAYKPVADGETRDGISSLDDLSALNPDVTAWLSVYGTSIDYPVVQGEDNIRYLKTDATGAYSVSGAIFVDSRNAPDFADFATVVYGHHMAGGQMFGDIGLFGDPDFFDTHRSGSLYFARHLHGLEFFAFVHTSAYDDLLLSGYGGSEAGSYLDAILSEAVHVRDSVSVTPDDHIVLLSTCSSRTTNGRDILIGKIVDEAQPDTSDESTSTGISWIPEFSHLSRLWPPSIWLVVALASIPLWLLLVLLLTRDRRRKDKPRRGKTDGGVPAVPARVGDEVSQDGGGRLGGGRVDVGEGGHG